jgi:hypothetical protein
MTAIAPAMADYRLHYLDRSRKFIRADRVDAVTDEEAIALAELRRLYTRSELWKGGQLVAKFPPRPAKRTPAHAQQD